jgi:Fe-S cluster assembly iron-binding protein IscA
MLTVTDAAGTRLAHIIDREERLEKVAVCLTHDGRRIAMTVDAARPGDTAFEHRSRTVLLLDEHVSRLLEDETLDVKRTHKGNRFTLRRGNATT